MSTPKFFLFNNTSYMDFYPIQFGYEDCDPFHSFGPSVRKHYIFHYITEGEGTLYISEANKHYVLKAGQGFLIPPHLISSYEADADNPWSYMWIEFSGIKAYHYIQQAGLDKGHYVFEQSKSPKESLVYNYLKELIDGHDKRSSYIIAKTYLFIDALIEESQSQTVTSHDDIKEFYIREALNFIERNYENNISVETIANHCNLNRHYFSRLFKEKMNISPQTFLISYRLSKSCELLRHTNMSLQEIAEAVGYSNQFNFSTAFKRHYNLSPLHWRKHHS
ncbi:AraC family transcriptional regulator [Streptococcus porcinus]|uniref:Transcriptional regulator, AraC family n=2 Tax=Streptococcus porcinus TaxID=1340 RepID=A0A4V0H830_STRPO|nr:AraC family transcriptional regulator [Streptococcus porcinus]EGJ27374.1 transcriptional regulator, AraC family [Streptococcus porcinus str. Jelinkova 176]SQG44924.1 transcriptional regulator, AraC family [Streptococcus porcinus]VTT45491.1 transcriptional regulator, AraC family [Streptococcus porcinus]VTT46941.1 transcriptional regulator, AraC family [Streptococcus porcinus]